MKGKISKKKITFLGVTFKANTDDMRDSTSLSMIPALKKKGAKITYYDPSGEKEEFFKLKNVIYSTSILDACFKADLIIIHTEWDEFKTIDFRKMSKNKKFKIFDMRNLYSPQKMKNLGIAYYSIGRPTY